MSSPGVVFVAVVERNGVEVARFDTSPGVSEAAFIKKLNDDLDRCTVEEFQRKWGIQAR